MSEATAEAIFLAVALTALIAWGYGDRLLAPLRLTWTAFVHAYKEARRD